MTVARVRCARSGEFLATVLDPGSFRSWDTPDPRPVRASAAYRRELVDAAAAAGVDESITTGEGSVDGQPVAVAVSDFGFLAGSIGSVAARRLVAAVEHATEARLPLLLSPASGGTRMHEGTPAFLEMVGIAAAVTRHRAAGLLVLSYLRHPTTGGSLASWGSLGSVTVAESGALVGFLGPKVYRALRGHPFPHGVQTAENLRGRGVLDAVASPAQLRELLGRLLGLIGQPGPATPSATTENPGPRGCPLPPWESVAATRRPDRPGLQDLLRRCAPEIVELWGTGAGEVAASTVLCLTRFGAQSCVLVGQDRRKGAVAPQGPADLRVARRGFRLAEELRLPLVTVIDTAGGDLSPDAENGALAGEIARCLSKMSTLTVPSVSVLAGQGAGGAALALFPADRRIAALHAWLTPLPPEGASAIVHGTPDRAAEVVSTQMIRSVDLAEIGAVHRIVAESPNGAEHCDGFLDRLATTIEQEIRVAKTRH